MKICALLIMMSVGFQVYVEVKQMMGDWKDYVEDYYNINDLFQYCATLWVVLATMFGQYDSGNMVAIRNLCCFILLSQGVKAVIDWLRLFDTTSFYVTLILRTVTDIGYFVVIIGVMITYTGCATYMLQLNSKSSDDAIIEPVFNNFLVDSVLSQYLLMLGEFSMDGFESHTNTALCFFLFFLTTFIMQITFLNMLIAIMGDTFDRVIEQRPTFSLKNKLMILAGFENIIRTDNAFDDTKVFLYVVQPVQSGDGDGVVDVDSTSEDWRGKVYYTHNLIKAKTESI